MDCGLHPFEMVINTYSVTTESFPLDIVLVRNYYVRLLRNTCTNWITCLLFIEKDIDAIIKDKVEELMLSEDRQNRYNYDILKTNVENTLKYLENDTDPFIDLLCSMRKRFDALKAAGGGHTHF